MLGGRRAGHSPGGPDLHGGGCSWAQISMGQGLTICTSRQTEEKLRPGSQGQHPVHTPSGVPLPMPSHPSVACNTPHTALGPTLQCGGRVAAPAGGLLARSWPRGEDRNCGHCHTPWPPVCETLESGGQAGDWSVGLGQPGARPGVVYLQC